jgi:hypothetical protein
MEPTTLTAVPISTCESMAMPVIAKQRLPSSSLRSNPGKGTPGSTFGCRALRRRMPDSQFDRLTGSVQGRTRAYL